LNNNIRALVEEEHANTGSSIDVGGPSSFKIAGEVLLWELPREGKPLGVVPCSRVGDNVNWDGIKRIIIREEGEVDVSWVFRIEVDLVDLVKDRERCSAKEYLRIRILINGVVSTRCLATETVKSGGLTQVGDGTSLDWIDHAKVAGRQDCGRNGEEEEDAERTFLAQPRRPLLPRSLDCDLVVRPPLPGQSRPERSRRQLESKCHLRLLPSRKTLWKQYPRK